MYETFDHTADVGLRVRAPTFGELLVEAARALTSVLVEDPSAAEADREEQIALSADSATDLLFDWLSELLFRFATRRFVAREFDMNATESRLTARVRGWRFDPDRHAGGHEIKAITYHGLKVERTREGWLAEVIVDI